MLDKSQRKSTPVLGSRSDKERQKECLSMRSCFSHSLFAGSCRDVGLGLIIHYIAAIENSCTDRDEKKVNYFWMRQGPLP